MSLRHTLSYKTQENRGKRPDNRLTGGLYILQKILEVSICCTPACQSTAGPLLFVDWSVGSVHNEQLIVCIYHAVKVMNQLNYAIVALAFSDVYCVWDSIDDQHTLQHKRQIRRGWNQHLTPDSEVSWPNVYKWNVLIFILKISQNPLLCYEIQYLWDWCFDVQQLGKENTGVRMMRLCRAEGWAGSQRQFHSTSPLHRQTWPQKLAPCQPSTLLRLPVSHFGRPLWDQGSCLLSNNTLNYLSKWNVKVKSAYFIMMQQKKNTFINAF